MDVSIIIVNYNTKEMTDNCIKSVIAKTQDVSYEIILVDNASTDGSREYFTGNKDITYVYSEENLGFGKGNNLGLKYSTGRNILFLNSDTILINNAVKILSDFIDRNHNVGICGGNLYDYCNKPTISFERERPGIVRELDLLLGQRLLKVIYGNSTRFNHSNRPMKVGYISGADFMTRKVVLDRYGGFSNDFFMYYEETELSDRIEKKGYSIMSVPDAKIIHLEGASVATGSQTSRLNERKVRWMYRSYFLYLNKCLRRTQRSITILIHWLTLWKRILQYRLKNDKKNVMIEKQILVIFNEFKKEYL